MGQVVAICGATGAVGQELLAILGERSYPVSEIRALASHRSAGRNVAFKGRPVKVRELSAETLEGVDVALFSAGSSISKELCPVARALGAVVIDNSSAFRYEDEIPLVVPEVNPDALQDHPGIIANPNCSTIQVVVAVAPILRSFGVKRMLCATYQAASGAGARAMRELEGQLEAFPGDAPEPEQFPHPLASNAIPRIDSLQENGYTREEMKMCWESRKILGVPDLRVSATCVRVPVMRAHAVAVHLETERPVTAEEARAVWSDAPGILVQDDPAADVYPTPLEAAGTDPVRIGRIRQDRAFENGLAFWVVADQIRKGAALNAVQIAEALL